MKLRNDKEINAFFASATQGVQLSLPTNRAKFSHRLHGCAQIRKQQCNLKICEHL